MEKWGGAKEEVTGLGHAKIKGGSGRGRMKKGTSILDSHKV